MAELSFEEHRGVRSPLAGWVPPVGDRLDVRELPFRVMYDVRVEPAVPALRLGPDEWLVVAEPGTEVPDDAVDVSAHRTTIALSGPAARDVLAHGCALDLDRLAPGGCAETLLARTGVILVVVDDAPTYHLLVRSSFARYLAAWLDDAAVGHI